MGKKKPGFLLSQSISEQRGLPGYHILIEIKNLVSHHPQPKKFLMGVVLVVGLTLACNSLAGFNPTGETPKLTATRVAPISENQRLVANAYAKIEALSSYRLAQDYTLTNETNPLNYSVVKVYDEQGNSHTQTWEANTLKHEVYVVAGRSYIFDPVYKGWVEREPTATEKGEFEEQTSLFYDNLPQLIAQFGAVPTQPKPDTLDGRAAIRYSLQHLFSEVAEAFDQAPTKLTVSLNGNLWVDTETGILLKSEIMVYEGQTGRVLQEHRLEISEIETVSPFAVPEPVVDPAAIVAATATAQVWTTLETTMNYRGTPLTFEFIPLEVRQVPDSSPLRAEVRVMIRKLPAYVLSEENIEPFLAQLRQQVTLSIPNRNLIVTSSGYELENQTQEPGVLRMSFDFNANLEDFNRIELILAGQGNPQFVPVPVK